MHELLGLLWKHLFCRNLCVLFAGCGRAHCPCDAIHSILFLLCSMWHFPGAELRGFFLQQYLVCLQLCLSATDHIYSAPTSPCSFLLLRLPFTSHCYHYYPLALPSFVLCLYGILLFHSPEVPLLFFKMNRSIFSIFASLLLGGSDILALLFGKLPNCF